MKNQKGSAMIFALIIMAVLVIFTPVVIFASNSETLDTVRYQKRMQAYYYARSGVENALDWLVDSGSLNSDFTNVYNGTAYIAGNVNSVQVHATQPAQDDIVVGMQMESHGIEIVSEGIFQDVKQSIAITVMFNNQGAYGIPDFDKAIFAISKGSSIDPAISILGSGSVEGDIGTNSELPGSLNLGSSVSIDGDVYTRIYQDTTGIPVWDSNTTYNTGNQVVYNGNIYTAISTSVNKQPDISKEWELSILGISKARVGDLYYYENDILYPDPVFPAFPTSLPTMTSIDLSGQNTHTISSDGYYDTIKLRSGTTLNIDLNNGTRTLRVRSFDIQMGHVRLLNRGDSGKLILYIDEKLNLAGTSTVNQDGEIKNLMVYYKGLDEPKFGGSTLLVGNLFIESADMKIAGNNGVTGHIISLGGSVVVTGTADLYTRVIYAPNAEVQILGSGMVVGSVIADSAMIDGSGQIEYQPIIADSFPMEIFPNGTGGTTGGTTSGSQSISYYHWH